MQRSDREREQYNKGLQRDRYRRVLWHCEHYYRQREIEIRTRALRYAEGKRVLELGSTTWRPWLERQDIIPSEVHCINISERELEQGITAAAGMRIQPEFHLMDAHKLEFEDRSFDVVLGLAMLHHLDFERALDEIKRVLKPGGMMVFKEPLDLNPVATLVRKLTPRARTVDEKPFRFKELRILRNTFDCQIHFMQLLSVPAGLLSGFVFKSPRNPLTYLAYATDRTLETVFPPIRYWYRNVLIIGRKEAAGLRDANVPDQHGSPGYGVPRSR